MFWEKYYNLETNFCYFFDLYVISALISILKTIFRPLELLHFKLDFQHENKVTGEVAPW